MQPGSRTAPLETDVERLNVKGVRDRIDYRRSTSHGVERQTTGTRCPGLSWAGQLPPSVFYATELFPVQHYT
jgi:hypothetical protein